MLIPDVFGVIDGGRMPCADYDDPYLQNCFYEGYNRNVKVTKILVFNFYSEIIHD